MDKVSFEWDHGKKETNIVKHGVSFFEAQRAFLDPKRIIAEDVEHSRGETRYYCFGQVDDDVMTVRFTYRNQKIRIFGAGFWRKGRKIYEEAQN
ncbi:MAG: BrnT family toxin [Simkania sp.]|nr:BrnT family toxin [Simkania sp.]